MRKVIDLADGIRSNTDPLEAVIDATNVAIEPAILWPANNAQSAINELREAGTEAATHIAAASDVHGVTGDVVGTSDAQVLTNKDYDGGEASNTVRLTLPANDSASIASLNRKAGTLIFDTDRKRVLLDDGVALKGIGSGGGGGGSIKWRIDTVGPLPGTRYFQEVFDFMAGEDQPLYMTMKLPSEYASGTPIKLKGSMVSVDTGTVDLLLLADISYTRPPTAMTSVDATRTSTNTVVAHTMSEVEVAQEFEIDVTDGDGKIDGDLLQAGDILLIKLYRDDGSLGDTSTLDLTFLPETTEVIFE